MNYSNHKWQGSSIANVSYYNSSARVAAFNFQIAFEVDISQILLKLPSSEIITVVEHIETQLNLFPLLYMLLVGVTMLVGASEASVRRASPLLVVMLTVKMFCRAVFLFTQSLTTVRPYGAVMVLLAVLTVVSTLRFAHRYHRSLGNRKHNRAATLTLLLLVGAELLLVFNPYYNCAMSLLLCMQIIANASTKRTAEPQHSITACFVVHHLLVVYFSLVEGNLIRVQPVPWVGYFIIVSVMLQLVGLKLQEYRYSIRRCLWRRTRKESVPGDCPICLCAIGN